MKATKEKLLLGLEALLLCVVLVFGLKPREVVENIEIVNTSMLTETQNGNQIVETDDISNQILRVDLPNLSVGSYELNVTYEAQDVQESYLQLDGGEDYFRSVLYNPTAFIAGENEMRMSFYLRDEATDLQAYVDGASTQLPVITGMELVQTSGAARMVFCLLLLVLTPMNLLYALYHYMGSHVVSKEQLLVWVGVPAIALVASIPVFTDYLLASTEMEQCLKLIEDVAQGGGWSGEALWMALPIGLRKLGFTLNLAYAVPILLENVCAALVAYGIFYLCFKTRIIAWLGCMFYILAPWRLEGLYLTHYAVLWKILVTALVALTGAYISSRMLACKNEVYKNIFFTGICGGYLLVAISCMNNMMLWTEGVIRLY